MELDVLDLYSFNFIFRLYSIAALVISYLVLILFLLLMFSRRLLNSFSISLCLDEISLTQSDKGCICFSIILSTFASWSAMMFFTDSLNSDIRFFQYSVDSSIRSLIVV